MSQLEIKIQENSEDFGSEIDESKQFSREPTSVESDSLDNLSIGLSIPSQYELESKAVIGSSLNLPVRTSCTIKIGVTDRNNLLKNLVERIRKLDGVFIPNLERRLNDGSVVSMSGAWQFCRTDDQVINHHFLPYQEFGYSHFLDEEADYIPDSKFDVGGQCVVSSEVSKECLATGWGCKHPFAGHFHPILRTYVPDSMIYFHAPNTVEDIDVLWKIVKHSYDWVHTVDAFPENNSPSAHRFMNK